MLFVTVGSELSFDRLVRVVDEWAGKTGRTDVFAQIGNTDWQPTFIEFKRFLDPAEFKRRLAAADRVVAHAGMGTILSALHLGKPILVMPRRAAFRETRNDHQVATVQRLLEMGRIDAALDEAELRVKLDELAALKGRGRIGPFAEERLLLALKQFIAGQLVGDRPA